jgi:parvulin-like peptidyl-prolyl isomerase
MMNIVYFEGVKATVQQFKFKFLAIALVAAFSIGLIGCGPGPEGPKGNGPDEVYATVNGKAINMQEVDRIVKQNAQGQEARLSPLELNQARLQVLQNLIQQEVMYQKAEKEKTIPTDDEVTTEFNKLKTSSGKSAEEFAKDMEKAGETEATVREGIKKQLAVNKLIEKVTGKIEPPKDSEIEAFYKGNPEAFVKKKGVKLSVIVVDPAKSGEGDPTVDEATARLKIQEIGTKLNQGIDFATVARENSEDQSRSNGGDIGYLSEDQLKQMYGGQLAGFMNPNIKTGQVIPVQLEGKYYFIKLVERSDKDENVTLETPGIRQQVTDSLTNARKSLVSQAYAAQAMNEAKIDNLLLKKIIDNPNDLSGARPAVSPGANTATSPTPASNTNTAVNSNTNTKANSTPAPANTKPAATPAANTTKANTNK